MEYSIPLTHRVVNLAHMCNYSAASMPYCGTYLFSFNNGAVYSHLGCSDIPYTSIATEVQALATATGSSTTAAPTTGAAATSTVIQQTTDVPTTAIFTPTARTSSAVVPNVPAPTSQIVVVVTTIATPTRNAAPAGGAGAGVLGGLAMFLGELALYLFWK